MTEQTPAPQAQQTPAPGADAPKKFAGKFETPEALEAAYKELESKVGTPARDDAAIATAREAFKALGKDGISPEQQALLKQYGEEDKPAAAEEKKPEEKKAEGTENHGTKPEHAGLPKGTDFGTFDAMVAKGFKAEEVKGFMGKMADGTFADADAKAIAEKMGVPVEAVKGYIEPRMAAAKAAPAAPREYTAQEIAHVQAGAGGEQAFAEVTAWAKTALKPEEVKAFNDAIDTGNPMIARLAVEGLKARHVAAVGQAPAKRVGGEGSVPSTDKYESNQELATAISDPRWHTDPKYRAAVEAKAARSTF